MVSSRFLVRVATAASVISLLGAQTTFAAKNQNAVLNGGAQSNVVGTMVVSSGNVVTSNQLGAGNQSNFTAPTSITTANSAVFSFANNSQTIHQH
jgi:hypothetical protein